MKCEKCGCETDFAIIAELGWYVMEDGKTLLIDGLSPASRKRVLCMGCFERCAEVFKKEDVLQPRLQRADSAQYCVKFV